MRDTQSLSYWWRHLQWNEIPRTYLCGVLRLCHTDGVIFIETTSLEYVYAGYWRSVILVASSSLKRSPSNIFMRGTRALSYWWRHLHWNEVPRTYSWGVLTLCHTDGIIFILTKSLEHVSTLFNADGVTFNQPYPSQTNLKNMSFEHVYTGYSSWWRHLHWYRRLNFRILTACKLTLINFA